MHIMPKEKGQMRFGEMHQRCNAKKCLLKLQKKRHRMSSTAKQGKTGATSWTALAGL